MIDKNGNTLTERVLEKLFSGPDCEISLEEANRQASEDMEWIRVNGKRVLATIGIVAVLYGGYKAVNYFSNHQPNKLNNIQQRAG